MLQWNVLIDLILNVIIRMYSGASLFPDQLQSLLCFRFISELKPVSLPDTTAPSHGFSVWIVNNYWSGNIAALNPVPALIHHAEISSVAQLHYSQIIITISVSRLAFLICRNVQKPCEPRISISDKWLFWEGNYFWKHWVADQQAEKRLHKQISSNSWFTGAGN